MQKTRNVGAQLWVERQTLKDKDSMFRAKMPDTGFIRIMALVEDKSIVLREFTFTDRDAYNAHWLHLKALFGGVRG